MGVQGNFNNNVNIPNANFNVGNFNAQPSFNVNVNPTVDYNMSPQRAEKNVKFGGVDLNLNAQPVNVNLGVSSGISGGVGVDINVSLIYN